MLSPTVIGVVPIAHAIGTASAESKDTPPPSRMEPRSEYRRALSSTHTQTVPPRPGISRLVPSREPQSHARDTVRPPVVRSPAEPGLAWFGVVLRCSSLLYFMPPLNFRQHPDTTPGKPANQQYSKPELNHQT